MSSASNSGRSANKRAMIDVVDLSDDDESTNGQPAEKSPKTGLESVSAQEVLELRHKVAKLEKDFEGACVYARQFELEKEEKQKRVEYLENLLEKKPAKIDDGKEKKLTEELEKCRDSVIALTKQLDAERSQADEDRKRDQVRVSSLMKELEVERWQANEERMKDRARIDELTRKLKQYEAGQHYCTAVLQQQSPQPLQAVQQPLVVAPQQSQHPQLQQQQPPQPPRAVQPALTVAPHKASLQPLQAVQQQQQPNLMQLLRVEMEKAVPQQPLPARSTNVPQQLRLQQPQPLAVAVQKPNLQLAPSPPSAVTSSSSVPDSKNIFKLYPHGTPNSITLKNGRKKIYIANSKNEMLQRGNAVFKGKKLHCSACDETFENGKILEHFISSEHRRSVVAHSPNNAISNTAINSWREKLRSISLPTAPTVEPNTVSPPPVTVALPITVAPPAPAANDRASTNVKRAPLVIEIDE